jgi:hypothetical protein
MEIENLKLCSHCKRSLPYSNYDKDSRAVDGLRYICVECRRKDANTRRKQDPEKQKLRFKKLMDRLKAEGICNKCCKNKVCEENCRLCSECREKELARRNRITQECKAKGICTSCWKNPMMEGYSQCEKCHLYDKKKGLKYKDKKILYGRKYNKDIKIEIINRYGGKCNCCGINVLDFLAIDHINNDGAKHRKALNNKNKGSGYHFYRWLKQNNFPSGFQVLCHNCNWSKHINHGKCIHQIERETNPSQDINLNEIKTYTLSEYAEKIN